MISVALLGYGTVGSGTAEVLDANKAQISKYVGDDVKVRYILDLRTFPGDKYEDLMITDFDSILEDKEISIVAEMIGGVGVAYKFTKALLMSGKNVVTSNKELVAKHGAELLDIAAAHGVRYLFEASVGGGIPIIRPLANDLVANGINSIDGILNGTTNYILTEMTENSAQLDDVLRSAQAKGYAEADPSADVKGFDAARKTVILAAMSFGKILDPDNIYTEGIMDVSADDINDVDTLGYRIKLIGHTEKINGRILAMVSPRCVAKSNPLYSVNDVFNGILVEDDMLGKAMFYGRGAGKLPTASAVVSDIVDIAAHRENRLSPLHWDIADKCDIADISDYSCESCLIFENVTDTKDKVEKVFGKLDHFSSIGNRFVCHIGAMTEKEIGDKIRCCQVKLIKRYRIL